MMNTKHENFFSKDINSQIKPLPGKHFAIHVQILLTFTISIYPSTMITITSKLTPSDLHKAMQIMARNNTSILLTNFLGYMQLIIGFVLLSKSWVQLHALSTSGIFFIFTGFLFAFAPALITRLKVQQLLQTENAFTEKIIYNFSTDGYDAKAQTYQLNGVWKNIFQIKESGRYLFIYLNKKTAMIISKNSFTDQQFSDFKDIIKNEEGISYRFAKDKK